MKKTFTALLLLFVAASAAMAQTTINFSYDASGNRTQRLQVTTRSFSSQDLSQEEETVEAMMQREVHVYPNPVQTELNVSLTELPEPGEGQLALYDMQGRVMLQQAVTTTELVIQMGDFPKGVYLMRIVFGSLATTWKIVKE